MFQTNKTWLFAVMSLLIVGFYFIFVLFKPSLKQPILPSDKSIGVSLSPAATQLPTPTPHPSRYIIPQRLHVFQTFNNCGPASLSMLLSYFDIAVTQKELGDTLRPFQNPNGDNDDKSVTLGELADEAENYGLKAFHRPNGNLDTLKQLIAADIPVIVRTRTKPNEDIGHYRVIRGYDEATGEIIQDDSLQGNDIRYSFEIFNQLWEGFNYEYLALAPPNDKAISILMDTSEITAWKKAVKNAEDRLQTDPESVYARFNLSVALYHIGEYQRSIEEFEKVEARLPFRTLWYQIEPIQAYFELKNHARVFEISENIINNYNRAFSELYVLRGKIYLEQNNRERAREQFELALFYNKNLDVARQAMDLL